MDLQTFSWQRGHGWSVAEFPELDSGQTLVLVFGSATLMADPAPIAELVQAYPASIIAGCSTAGEIFGTEITDDSLSVAVARFTHSSLRHASVGIDHTGASRTAGKQLATALAGEGLRSVLVLSDGLSVNGTELVNGLNAVLPEDVVVTGGLAGDGDRFERTWILNDGRPATGRVSAIGIYGDRVRVGHGSRGGWDIFGPKRRITRSRGNVLLELDGQPALELYKRYLGELAAGLPATALHFPLALSFGADDDRTVVRTILAVDEQQQSMTFAGDMPKGAEAQLMRANFDRLVDGAMTAALMTRESCPDHDGPVLSIAISCVGRRLVLGEAAEEEVESLIEVLPANTQQVGFYSYGEISPYASGHCDLHNQTMTITTISEAA